MLAFWRSRGSDMRDSRSSLEWTRVHFACTILDTLQLGYLRNSDGFARPPTDLLSERQLLLAGLCQSQAFDHCGAPVGTSVLGCRDTPGQGNEDTAFAR